MTGSENPMAWRKSSRCESHTCVEVAARPGAALVRDGKDPLGAVLVFGRPAWQTFLGSVAR